MDKLQEWLAKKEGGSASPSLRSKPAKLASKLKQRIKSAFRTHFGLIEQVPQKPNKLEEYTTQKHAENYQYGEKFNPTREMEERYWSQKSAHGSFPSLSKLIKLASDVADARTAPGIGLNRVWNEYEAAQRSCKILGHEWDTSERIKQKLVSERVKSAEKARRNFISDLTKKIEAGALTAYDLSDMLWKEDMLSNELRQLGVNAPSEKDNLFAQAIAEYDKKAPFVPVSEFYAAHPRHIILHGITGVGNGNNCVVNAGNKQARDLFSLVIDEKPSISCTAFSPGDSSFANIYGACGVIIGDGKIHSAVWQDAGSAALAKKLRLVHTISGPKEKIEADIERAIGFRTGFNELVVAQPEVRGIYFIDNSLQAGVTRLRSCMSYDALAQLAKDRNLPLYRLSYKEGLVELDPDEVISRAGRSTSSKAIAV